MGKIYTHNNKIITLNDKWLETNDEPVYPFATVKIGNQLWMAENLAVDDGGEGISAPTFTINGVDFGTQYVYSYAAAVRVAATVDGWHLPTYSDFQTLAVTIGGSSDLSSSGRSANGASVTAKITSTSGWKYTQGTNETGLNILPIGGTNDGLYGWLWMVANYDYNCLRIYKSRLSNYLDCAYRDEYWYPVRLVKDT